MCSFSFVVSVLNSSYFISSQYQMNLTPDLLCVPESTMQPSVSAGVSTN